LGISLHTIDLSREFEEHVITPFVRDYLSGRTPNPCAVCNKFVKFHLLRRASRDKGYPAFATGHYARVEKDPSNGPSLFRGADPRKDQSYFLSLVGTEDLTDVRLPLGTWTKKKGKALLEKLGCRPVLHKESQEVCFIPGNDYRSFLQTRISELPGPGPVIDRTGVVMGEHEGLWRYTLGQRRGLGIPHSEPLYVIDKIQEDNALVVGNRDELLSQRCTLGDVNFLVPPERWSEEVLVQTVYRQRPKPALIRRNGSTLTIRFDSPLPRPCPGQVGAVYTSSGQVLAGGIIRASL
ncbi:MAG: tRNA 2-thiouridine(34) synthase MnmA, partial [Desulfovibrionales bacterium]